MSNTQVTIREAKPKEHQPLGQLMVKVYSNLAGFPGIDEMPSYYEMLANVGTLTERPGTHLLIAVDEEETLLGGVVYFSDMESYGSRSSVTEAENASGIRLLAVDPLATGKGVGRALTQACIYRAKEHGHAEVLLHSTELMKVAWGLYERMGFESAPEYDFNQDNLPVFGFRLKL